MTFFEDDDVLLSKMSNMHYPKGLAPALLLNSLPSCRSWGDLDRENFLLVFPQKTWWGKYVTSCLRPILAAAAAPGSL